MRSREGRDFHAGGSVALALLFNALGLADFDVVASGAVALFQELTTLSAIDDAVVADDFGFVVAASVLPARNGVMMVG